MGRQDNRAIEDQAQRLLDEIGIRTIPVPVDRIAKALGAQLHYTVLDDELSGMIFIKDDVPIIGVNSIHHPNRQRFTIAHEIAHLRLHRSAISAEVHVDKRFQEPGRASVLKRDALAATGTDRHEIDANEFAAALLIPRAHLDEILDKMKIDLVDGDSLEVIAKKFKVSRMTLEYRIRNLRSRH
jgi:Zn-dependent peptidase ImmA (M78 family)